MQIELKKALKFRDEEIYSLELDLESMTGNDLLRVEDDLRVQGINIPAWEYSRAFLINVAARASKLPVEVLRGLGLGDFTRVINAVLSFLGGQDSGESMVENSVE